MAPYLLPKPPVALAHGPEGSLYTGTSLATLSNGNVVQVSSWQLEGPKTTRSFAGFTVHDASGGGVGASGVIVRGGPSFVDPFLGNLVDRIRAPDVIALERGGFVATWTEQDGDGADRISMAQRYSNTGVAQGDPIEVEGKLAPLSGGGFVSVHTVENFFTPENNGVWVQPYRANGQPRGEATRIEGTETTSGLSLQPFGIGLDGELTVSFEVGVFTRTVRLDANGAQTGEVFVATAQPKAAPLTRQADAFVTQISEDRLAAVWHGTFKTGVESDILLRTMDGDGSDASRIYRINQHTEGQQLFAQAVPRADGGLIVLWRDADARGDDEAAIYARQVRPNGKPQGPEIRLTPFDQSLHRTFDAAQSGDGSLLLSWTQSGTVIDGFLELIDTQFSGTADFGTKARNILNGSGADDLIAGRAGNDRLTLRNGDDAGYGEAGRDRVDGGSGNDLLSGGLGNDTLIGGKGADIATGDNGNDRVLGGPGADTLLGGAGNDTVLGGGQNDLLSGDLGDDVVNGGGGSDRVDGDVGDDLVIGGAGADTVLGSDGNDTLRGGGGADLLFGGDGTDLLIAGAGDDQLNLGAGGDSATGGNGADTFSFNSFSGESTITDFELGVDILEIQAADRFAPIAGMTKRQIVNTFGEVIDGDTVLDFGVVGFGDPTVITLEGVTNLAALARSIEFA